MSVCLVFWSSHNNSDLSDQEMKNFTNKKKRVSTWDQILVIIVKFEADEIFLMRVEKDEVLA